MKPNYVRKVFFNILSNAKDNIHEFVHNPGKDMTRRRCCSFEDTVLATLNFSMERTNTELFNFFENRKRETPSKSAFTQQRKKLNHRLFPYLLRELNNHIPLKRTFKGFHLLAIDGTDINLPTDKHDMKYRVKQARSDGSYYQIHLNALYDILENRYVDAITQPRPECHETLALREMMERCTMPKKTIFIADRGYVSSNLMAHMIENNFYFLIRVKAPDSASSYIKYQMEPNVECDKKLPLNLTRSYVKYKSDRSTHKYLRPDREFDFIEPGDKETLYTLPLRYTCVKLDEDSYEYLISNLPFDTFSADDLKALYWKRWSIETSFRSLKYAFSIVYLHSLNRDLIIQEIFAKMLLFNFTALIYTYAQKSRELLEKLKKRKRKYKVSFADAVPIAKRVLTHKLRNRKIKALLLKHLTVIKKTAAPARRLRSQTVKPLNNRA